MPSSLKYMIPWLLFPVELLGPGWECFLLKSQLRDEEKEISANSLEYFGSKATQRSVLWAHSHHPQEFR